jgi:hypothetical protein
MKRNVLIRVLAGIVLAGSAVQTVQADMGSIYVGSVKVTEEGQKAIILHNGQEEVLILGTDLRAAGKAGTVRFIPFPAEPAVSLAPEKAFESVAGLVKEHELQTLHFTKGGGNSASQVEITFNARLGVHDITVVRINDILGFRNWVKDFFSKKGFPLRVELTEIEAVAADYVARGFDWFVFDYVDVQAQTRMMAPVEYRFRSKQLYYPLKTSNTFGGVGGIDLILISHVTPASQLGPMGLGMFGMQPTTSSELRVGELSEIMPDAAAFFGAGPLFVQMATFWGTYNFDRDLLLDLNKGVPYAVWMEQTRKGVAYDGLAGDDNVPYYTFTRRISVKGAFSIEVPMEWNFMELPGDGAIEVTGKTDGTKADLLLKVDFCSGKEQTITQWLTQLIRPAAKPAYEDYSRIDTMEVNGRVTYLLTMKGHKAATQAGDTVEKVVRRYAVVTSGGGYYRLIFEAPAAVSLRYKPLFDRMVKSFEKR